MRTPEKTVAVAILTGALVGVGATAALAQNEPAPGTVGSESGASQTPAESEAPTEETGDSSTLDKLNDIDLSDPLSLLGSGLLG
ncbi:MAG: hypothetical protein M0026_01770 [Nocardiopsaceae bacterium]|nr:hypothetical protein [Nocardiopsaceae bacterium]